MKSFEAEDQGKLKLSATDIPLNFREAFQTQVDLKDADIHWLGGAVTNIVKPLEGKLSGKMQMQFTPERGNSWRLICKNDLVVDEFQLRSAKIAVLKPVIPFKMIGPFAVLASKAKASSILKR